MSLTPLNLGKTYPSRKPYLLATKSDLRENILNVGFVQGGKREALHSEMVVRYAHVDKCRPAHLAPIIPFLQSARLKRRAFFAPGFRLRRVLRASYAQRKEMSHKWTKEKTKERKKEKENSTGKDWIFHPRRLQDRRFSS